MNSTNDTEKASSLLATLLPLVLEIISTEVNASKGKWVKAFPSKEIRGFFDASLKKIDNQKNDAARIIGQEIGNALAKAMIQHMPVILKNLDVNISFNLAQKQSTGSPKSKSSKRPSAKK